MTWHGLVKHRHGATAWSMDGCVEKRMKWVLPQYPGDFTLADPLRKSQDGAKRREKPMPNDLGIYRVVLQVGILCQE
jgi:hypothetical protein